MPENVIVVRLNKKACGAGAAGALAVVLGLYFSWSGLGSFDATLGTAPANAAAPETSPANTAAATTPPTLQLNDTQAAAVKVETVGDHLFPREKQAVGNIDFNFADLRLVNFL